MSLMRALGFVSEAFALRRGLSEIGSSPSHLLPDRGRQDARDDRARASSSLGRIGQPDSHRPDHGPPRDGEGRTRALKAGVICYLTKPFKEDDLLGCIHSALDTARTMGRAHDHRRTDGSPRAQCKRSACAQAAGPAQVAEPTSRGHRSGSCPGRARDRVRALPPAPDTTASAARREAGSAREPRSGHPVALVERPGELVSKSELMARVWPNTFVEEGNLKVQVAGLRRALGDGRGSNRYLATVPGRGYRFVAPVTHVEVRPAPRRASAHNLPAPIARMVDRTTCRGGAHSPTVALSPHHDRGPRRHR